MSEQTSPLDGVKIAAPCPADWDSMIGNERVRFCGQCQLNVYNLSGMSRREAEALIRRAEGRLCVRFYRRADGTMLTRDCPVGLRAIKRRASRVARATLSAAVTFLSGLGLNLAWGRGVLPERRTTGAALGGRQVATFVTAAPAFKEPEPVTGRLVASVKEYRASKKRIKAKRLRAER